MFGHAGLDDHSRLLGHAIASYADYSYGELLVRAIKGTLPKDDPDTREVLRYLRPAPELAKEKYAARIQEWEIGAETPTAALKSVANLPGPYPTGCYGLGDQAQVLADAARIPVVTDAFRVPLHRKSLVTSGKLDQALRSLRESESLFCRIEDGAVLMRHGGFWRLRTNEPPEGPMRRLESVAKPTLDDYANALGAWMGEYGGFNASLNRLRSPNTLLLRASQEPFLKWTPALLTYASLADHERKRLWAGQVLDLVPRVGIPKWDMKSVKWYVGPYEERAHSYAVLYGIEYRGRNRYQGLPYWASGQSFEIRFDFDTERHYDGLKDYTWYGFSYHWRWSGLGFLEYLAGRNKWQKSVYEGLRQGDYRLIGANVPLKKEEMPLYQQLYYPATQMWVSVKSSHAPGRGQFDFWFGNMKYQDVLYEIAIP